ncbi:hypothetical protein KC340_g79 [Hortaea werneckii]|nr:hypothetical protein KC340_g79 [Hortaea werneckii]
MSIANTLVWLLVNDKSVRKVLDRSANYKELVSVTFRLGFLATSIRLTHAVSFFALSSRSALLTMRPDEGTGQRTDLVVSGHVHSTVHAGCGKNMTTWSENARVFIQIDVSISAQHQQVSVQ